MAIRRCGVLLLLACLLSCQTMGMELLHPNSDVRSWSNSVHGVTVAIPTSRSFFNSRLEYSNKWLPIGRGDPLKNDPTYDYSPPAIDHRIHYWDEKSTESNGNKNEILLLGVSSRRQYNNYDRRPLDISTVMLPPPIQAVQKVNFKSEKSPNRQTPFGTHKKWQDKPIDSSAAESNVQPTIVLPNSAPTIYDHKFNANAEDVNQLSHIDYQSPMFTKSNQSKKPWLQDLLRKEVTRPSSHVQIEALTMHKLDDSTYYKSKMPVEFNTEMTPPYFVPTIQPMIANDDLTSLLFKETPKPMSPMNLIIQGHSRVKTYGQGTAERDPKIIEVKSMDNPVVNRVVSEDENGIKFDVKHLHAATSNRTTPMPTNSTAESIKSPAAGLLSLLDLSFGDILDNVTMPDAVKNQSKSNEIKIL